MYLNVYAFFYKMVYFITGCLHLDYPVSFLVQLCGFFLPTLRPCATLRYLVLPCDTLWYLAVFSMTGADGVRKFTGMSIFSGTNRNG